MSSLLWRLLLTVTVVISLVACSSGGTGGVAKPVELSVGGACGEAFFWASNPTGDVAVTISVDARDRSQSGPTKISVVLPDRSVTARVLRGQQLPTNFCNDVIDGDSEPTAEQDAVTGMGQIVLDPPGNDGVTARCGGARGTLRLSGVTAKDGTRFAPILVESAGIGCYAG